MSRSIRILAMAGLMTLPALATADSPHSVTSNVALTTDYVFRGVSQTQNRPALQGGFDYAHRMGLYAGLWASNQAWVEAGGFKSNSSLEVDVYAGYKASLGDFGFDVGIATYYYPGDPVAGANDPDTTEVYAGVSWGPLGLKYNHVVSEYFAGWGTAADPAGRTRGSWYLALSGSHDLGGGWGLLGSVGYQDVRRNRLASYTDWKLGVSKSLAFGTLTVAYTDTDADTPTYTWAGKRVADERVTLTFSRTF